MSNQSIHVFKNDTNVKEAFSKIKIYLPGNAIGLRKPVMRKSLLTSF